MAGMGGAGGIGGMAGGGGMGGMGGGGMGGSGCPAGADTPETVSLKVDAVYVSSYDVAAAGLLVTPGPGSEDLYGDAAVGMGTTALGNFRSIESGVINESIVFEIFQSNGVDLGAPEGATNVILRLNGASNATFNLSAEDRDGVDLGSADTTIGNRIVDVSALIPGEIHMLTIEATGIPVITTGIDYTHVCLGYEPAP